MIHHIDTTSMHAAEFVDTMPVQRNEPGYDDALPEGSAIAFLAVAVVIVLSCLAAVHLIARVAA